MKQINFFGVGILLILSGTFPSQAQQRISLESLVGYYDVGVKPNKPFFKSRWYMRDDQLYAIYDSDLDRPVNIFQDGELSYNVFLSEEDVPETRDDSTYYLILNYDGEQKVLKGFKVLRPRKDWPTDLYAYRNESQTHLAVDTEAKLTYEKRSDHFLIQYSEVDTEIIQGMIDRLEEKYTSLVKDFKLDSMPMTTIRVYPDKETYDNAVLRPNAPLWQMGRVWDKNEIRMLSPITAQELTGEKLEVNEITVHELIHSLHLNLVKDGTRVPGWFWEGLAMYKGCCQWVDNPFDLEYMKKGRYPTLKRIEKDPTYELQYDLGYFFIQYIVETYGWEKVLDLISSNVNLPSSLGISNKSFEQDFYSYLEEKYQNQGD